jgi:hypothetical protein
VLDRALKALLAELAKKKFGDARAAGFIPPESGCAEHVLCEEGAAEPKSAGGGEAGRLGA